MWQCQMPYTQNEIHETLFIIKKYLSKLFCNLALKLSYTYAKILYYAKISRSVSKKSFITEIIYISRKLFST